MQLERWWRRKIVQATGAGVVAPVAIVAATLAVGIGGGGIRGLGALGQTLTGPEVPTTAGIIQAAGPGTDNLLARVNRSGRPSPAAERPAGTSSPPVRRRSNTRARRRPARSPSRGPARRPTSPTRPAPQPEPSQQPTPAPPPPTPTPSLIRQVGDDVKEVTDPVPVVGPPAGQVIDTIVDTADEVIPPAPKLP